MQAYGSKMSRFDDMCSYCLLVLISCGLLYYVCHGIGCCSAGRFAKNVYCACTNCTAILHWRLCMHVLLEQDQQARVL